MKSDLKFHIWNYNAQSGKLPLVADIKIFLNGEIRDVPVGIHLDRLLELFSLQKQRIAIELNKTVIRRPDWHRVVVKDGDMIEVVHFVGGG